MAGPYSSLPLARFLLLVVVLQDYGAVARPLLGIAEPPASPGAVATGPAAAAQSGGGDRSEAGGEVIVAGFAAALIIVIFCYIRVTRETNDSSVGAGEKKETLGGF